MTIEEIKGKLERIKSAAGDDEVQHIMEDRLYSEAIEFIAKGGTLTAEMGLEILKTKEMDFSRWCA